MKFSPSLIFIFLFFSFSSGKADNLYVLKNVKVHTEASLESPVIKLLLGGEKVNVLSIDGDFTEIEDNAKKVGWVASGFLTNIEPRKVTKAISSNKPLDIKTKTKTKTKPNKQTTASKSTSSKPSQNKPKLNDQLKEKFAKEISLDLQKQNKQLLKQLNKIRQILKLPDSTDQSVDRKPVDKDDCSKNKSTLNLLGFKIKDPNMIILAILMTLILGFILGLLWSDYRQRRKHGGFKV